MILKKDSGNPSAAEHDPIFPFRARASSGRADLTGGNFDELREHICSRLFVLPGDTTVYPGHGDPTTIGIEKKNNPFFR